MIAQPAGPKIFVEQELTMLPAADWFMKSHSGFVASDHIYVGDDDIAGGLFVKVGRSYSNTPFYTSTDGLDYTGVATTPSSYHTIWALCFGQDTVVAIGVNYSNDLYSYLSTDGATWTPYNTNLNNNADAGYAVAHSDDLSLFVGALGLGGTMYSSDGITWTFVASSDGSGYFDSIVWFPEESMFIASSGSTYFTSTDGITWTKRTTPVTYSSFRKFRHYNGMVIACTGSNGHVAAYTTDGLNWNAITLPDGFYAYDVAYGNGRYIFSGQYLDTGNRSTAFWCYFIESKLLTGPWRFQPSAGNRTRSASGFAPTANIIRGEDRFSSASTEHHGVNIDFVPQIPV